MNLYTILILLMHNNIFIKHTILPITSNAKLRKYNTTNTGYDMTKNDTYINLKDFFIKKELLDKLTSNISIIEKQALLTNNEIKPFNLSMNSLVKEWYYDL